MPPFLGVIYKIEKREETVPSRVRTCLVKRDLEGLEQTAFTRFPEAPSGGRLCACANAARPPRPSPYPGVTAHVWPVRGRSRLPRWGSLCAVRRLRNRLWFFFSCGSFPSAVEEEGFQLVVSGDGCRAERGTWLLLYETRPRGPRPGKVRAAGLRQSRCGEEPTPRPGQHESSPPARNGTGPTALHSFVPDVQASAPVSWGLRRQVCWAQGVEWRRPGPSSPGQAGARETYRY